MMAVVKKTRGLMRYGARLIGILRKWKGYYVVPWLLPLPSDVSMQGSKEKEILTGSTSSGTQADAIWRRGHFFGDPAF